ncbi:hypothetical protein J7E71_14095 [Mesobacillus foraminis]|nr:hypothetical protein [Mesobacillus foraminis]MBT2757075.1 hypothetical protein [Mesobacillus foraminis]
MSIAAGHIARRFYDFMYVLDYVLLLLSLCAMPGPGPVTGLNMAQALV